MPVSVCNSFVNAVLRLQPSLPEENTTEGCFGLKQYFPFDSVFEITELSKQLLQFGMLFGSFGIRLELSLSELDANKSLIESLMSSLFCINKEQCTKCSGS